MPTCLTASPLAPTTQLMPVAAAGACDKDVSSVAALVPALDSVHLLRGHKSITIAHNGALYRLQSTRLGKLILTK